MAHLCVPQNQALGVCRGFVPDIQVCDTHGREDLVNATSTLHAEEEEIAIRTESVTQFIITKRCIVVFDAGF